VTQSDVTIGLDLVADNPNLTFIFFVAFVLQAMISVRFAYYAGRNRRASDVTGQDVIWGVLLWVGLTGGAYAVVGIVDIASSIEAPYRNGIMVAHVALLALALRALRDSAVPMTDGDGRVDRSTASLVLWVLAVVVSVGIVAWTARTGTTERVFAAEGLAAIAFAAVGVTAGLRATAESRVQGTVIDTLLRHLLPVLLFASFVPAVTLAGFGGLSLDVVLHVQVVFVIMTATALMTATIKLRQNLAGL
jgi:hypothetical protein